MICKIYPVKEGDVMPYQHIAEYGNFPWYKKTESPRQAEIERFHQGLSEGMQYDPMNNTLTNFATGAAIDVKTGQPVA